MFALSSISLQKRCISDFNCGAGTICVNRQLLDSNCVNGECQTNQRIVECCPGDSSCGSNVQCGADYACHQNVAGIIDCTSQCCVGYQGYRDKPCPSGQKCNAGQCTTGSCPGGQYNNPDGICTCTYGTSFLGNCSGPNDQTNLLIIVVGVIIIGAFVYWGNMKKKTIAQGEMNRRIGKPKKK